MIRLRASAVLTLAAVALGLACGNNNPGPPPSCAVACDTLDTCRIRSSGLSCSDNSCSLPGCAQCINGSPCSSILAGYCAGPCPGVTFSAK